MSTVVESSTSFTISTVPGGEALGIENGTIPDENITASSSAGPAPAYLARLNAPSAWCAGKAEDCYLQVDLGNLHLVCAVATQGNPGGNRDYVKRYKLQCSSDGVNWTVYEENGNTIIEGNTDNASVKRKDLEQEVVTRYVRFSPVDWYCWPCLRVEVYGAALNINEKIAELHPDDGGGFVLEKVLVTTYETHADENGEADGEEGSLKEQEKMTSELIIEAAKEYQYPVHIYTGDKWGAGTDANVLITIFGEEGESEETKLDNSSNNFERGQKDSFTITCGTYLGRLKKIRIGHDNTGFGAAWFLDKVTVQDPQAGEEVTFSCQRWFSTSDDDGKISRELTRDDNDDETLIEKGNIVGVQFKEREIITVEGYQYPVHIYTGDKWGAGTDANVLITIFGEEGESDETKLDNSSNNFERGQKDSFTISSGAYLGRLTKIRIGHDNTGFGAAWFLDKVTVQDPKTGKPVHFSCQRWFSTSEDDGKITRELTRDDKDDESLIGKENIVGVQPKEGEIKTVEDHQYPVHIYTGFKWGAGTDANVLITIFGEEGESEETKLDNSSNNFERGQKVSFTISSGAYLGRLTKIRIGHDNTGLSAAWFLDKVTVEDPKTGESVDFSCQRWFSTNEDDGKISRELARDDKDLIVAKEEAADLRAGNEGGFGEEKVLVAASEIHVKVNGGPERDESFLKEQEKRIIRDAKERQRKEEEQQNRLEEIQLIIEQEEVKRKPSDDEMEKERMKAEASIKLVLQEEKLIERREKPDGQDEPEKPEGQVEERLSPVKKEYTRIEDEHRKRMEEIELILGQDEERRKREKEERKKAEDKAKKKKEEERRKRDEELKKKREEERMKWEEEHKKWEEERKKRDQELQAVLEEGRRKREEDRRKREEEFKKNREEERKKREEERKKRMEEETRKLEELRKEREERWKKKADVAVVSVDLTLQTKTDEEDAKNRTEEKKKKEHGWKTAVEAPRKVEEEMKRFRDEERKRLEEERKKQREKELAEVESEKEYRSEIRVIRRGDEPETRTHVSVTTLEIGPSRDVTISEEKRRIEWRMEKIEQDRKQREVEEKKRKEEAERKKKEEEGKLRQEEERKRKEQEDERQRRRDELRVKREEEERRKREEDARNREKEEIRRKTSLEEKRKRLEEERKRREEEERMWRYEIEQKKVREEEERRKHIESKKIKRLSIERKKFDEEEKKRLDAFERKRIEEEERARMEDEQRRREEREKWKMKQMEKKRSGEIYRRKSEEDLRNREDRASWKERQRKKRDSKSFETKWMFVNGENVEVPANESVSSSVSDTSYGEPDIFVSASPETRYVSVRTTETKRAEQTPGDKDEKDSSQATSTIRVITTTTTTTRTRYQGSRDKLPSTTSSQTSLNEDVTPFRCQPRCDHLLPTDPAVQMAVEESFFDKFEEEGKLRPFPSWYGGLDMGSLPHLYSPSNPITDSDIDQLLAIENEDFKLWKRVKKSRELEIYSRKGTERGSPPVTRAVIVLKDVPYRDAIDLVSDWEERSKWDKTFDGVSFLDQMADFKVLKCSQQKKNRCFVLASLDREDEEPYYAWAWKAANHPSVPGEDTKVNVLRMETGICGAIIRPYYDATRSSKITIITQVRGSVPSPLKSTYLTGNPSKWLVWLKKHYDSRRKNTEGKDEGENNRDDSSSISSKSDKQEQ